MSQRIVIISPCRNEEAYIERTIGSMVAQTRKPDRWIIVDDGSTDATAEIVKKYLPEHPWMELISTRRDGPRRLGAPVVQAFNHGYEHLGDDDWDFIAKLDCDLELPPDCIEKHLVLFEDPNVGAAGGGVHLVLDDGSLEFERYEDHFVPGQAKFYRRACFEDIGGFKEIIGWDYVDVIDARRHGWKTISDKSIVIKHFRLMGKEAGSLRSRYRWGQATWIIGSHPLFAILKGMYRMLDRPWFVGGLAIIAGYIGSYFNPKIKRIDDKGLIRHVRREQMYRLRHGNRLPPIEKDPEVNS